jgi:hypothetical protein
MPTDSVDKSICPPENCHARRHIRPAAFVTYDAAVAMCKSKPGYKLKDELIFYGELGTLANRNNRGTQQESEAIDSLVESGWFIELEERRRFRGRFTTGKYRIVEHEEFAKTHSCPPYKYDPDTGERIGRVRGAQPANLWPPMAPTPLGIAIAEVMGNLSEERRAEIAEELKKRTGTGNPVSVVESTLTDTGNPVPVPTRENPTTDTEKPVLDRHGKFRDKPVYISR